MQIQYTNKIKNKVKDTVAIRKNYGGMADSIELCISVLLAVDNLAQVPNVPPTRRHKLQDTWALDVSKNWRMILRPLEGEAPENVTAVEIVDILDYH